MKLREKLRLFSAWDENMLWTDDSCHSPRSRVSLTKEREFYFRKRVQEENWQNLSPRREKTVMHAWRAERKKSREKMFWCSRFLDSFSLIIFTCSLLHFCKHLTDANLLYRSRFHKKGLRHEKLQKLMKFSGLLTLFNSEVVSKWRSFFARDL